MKHITCMTSLRNTGCVANPVIPDEDSPICNTTKRFILDPAELFYFIFYFFGKKWSG